MSARPNLEGSWAKLQRAEQQLDELDANLREYVEGKPYEVSPEPEQRGDCFIWRYTKVTKPDPHFAVQLGEIIHDMRSSLDHLTWQLVRLNGVDTPDHRNEFPICEIEDSPKPQIPGDRRQPWNTKKTLTMLHGVHPTHIAMIQSAQPYKRGASAKRDPLLVLDALWNIDKHRILHAALLKIPKEFRPRGLTVATYGFSGVRGEMRVKPGRLKRGAEAYSFCILASPYGFPQKVYVSAEVPFEVTFGQRRVRIRRMKALGRYLVTKIFEPFAREFPKPRRPNDRPVFHDPDPKFEKATGPPKVQAFLPSESPAIFDAWKVWFDAGSFEGAEPAWYFISPEGAGFHLGVSGLDEAGFRAALSQMEFPDPEALLSFFEPRVRDTPIGRMFCPGRGEA